MVIIRKRKTNIPTDFVIPEDLNDKDHFYDKISILS